MAREKVVQIKCDATGEVYEEGTPGSATVRVDVVGEPYFRNLDFSPGAVAKLPNPDAPGSRRKRSEPKEEKAEEKK